MSGVAQGPGGDKLLRYGDTITLYCQDVNGYVNAGGFIDSRIWVDGLKKGTELPANVRDCRFRIFTNFQYSANTVLKKYLESISKTEDYIGSSESLDDERLAVLVGQRDEEREANTIENERVFGKPLTYGATIQLFHVASEKFVTVQSTIADYHHKALKMTVDEGGSEGSWLTVTPGYNTLSDGARVRHGDMIRLACTQYTNQYCCITDTSKGPQLGRRLAASVEKVFEVNSASSAARLKVVPAARVALGGTADTQADADVSIRGGSIVCLYHKDTAAFLCVHKNIPVWRVPRKRGLKHQRPSTSFWAIETVLVEWNAEECEWTKNYRFQHVTTGLYLTVGAGSASAKGAGGAGNEMAVSVDSTNSGDSSLWQMHPFGESSGQRVSQDSLLFIRHSNMGWLHESGYATISDDRASELRKLKRVVVSNEFLDKDVLMVVTVPQEMVITTLRVSRITSMIHQHAARTEAVPAPSASPDDRARAANAVKNEFSSNKNVLQQLKVLIRCITLSDNEDPFTREGLPVKSYQKVAREQGLMDALVRMVSVPLERGMSMDKNDPVFIGQPQYRDVLQCCQLSYRLMKHYVRDYNKNGLDLSRHINQMLKHLGGPFMAALTLMELFDSNRELLTTCVDAEIVEKFVLLLVNLGKAPRFIRFLSAITTCDGDPLPMNQDLVVTGLLKGKYDLILDTDLQRRGGDVFFYIREAGKDWISLAKFHGRSDEIFKKNELDCEPDELLLRYHVRVIELLAELLLGRNRNAFQAIISLKSSNVSYQDLLTLAFHNSMPYKIRRAYAVLLLRLYVDRDPSVPMHGIEGVRISGNPIPSQENHPFDSGVDGSQSGETSSRRSYDLSSFDKYSPFKSAAYGHLAPTPGFSDLKKSIRSCLQKIRVLDPTRTSENEYTLAILQMLSFLMRFGYLGKDQSGIHELVDMMTFILPLLSERMDPRKGRDRYEITEDNVIVAGIKKEVCNIVTFAMDRRADVRITMLFDAFDRSYRIPKPSRNRRLSQDVVMDGGAHGNFQPVPTALEMLPLTSDSAPEGRVILHGRSLGSLSSKLFSKTVSSIAGDSSEIIDAMMELTNYDDMELTGTAIKILFRELQQRAAFVERARTVVPLVTQDAILVNQAVQYDVREINRMLKWLPEESRRMYQQTENEDSYIICSRAVQDLRALLDKKDSVTLRQNQDIMRIQDVLPTILTLLKLPLVSTPVEGGLKPAIPERRDLFQQCYFLLRDFVNRNEQNQLDTFPYVDMFSRHMGVLDLNVADTITATIRDNRALMNRVPGRLFTSFAELITKYGRMPRWLRFYRMYLSVGGNYIKQNQNMVLKVMLDNDLMETSETVEGSGVVPLLVAGDHRKALGSKLMYYCTCVDILTECCIGGNSASHSKVRALFPFDTVVSRLLNSLKATPQVPWNDMCYMRIPLTRMLASVYMANTLPAVSMEILDFPNNGLFTSGKGSDSLFDTFETHLRDLTNDLRAGLPDKDVEFQLEYICIGVLPAIEQYYNNHHPETMSDEAMMTILDDKMTAIFLVSDTLLTLPAFEKYMMRHSKAHAMRSMVASYRESLKDFIDEARASQAQALNIDESNESAVVEPVKPHKAAKTTRKKSTVWNTDSECGLMLSTQPFNVDSEYRASYLATLEEFGKSIGIADLKRLLGPGMRSMSKLLGERENTFVVNNMIEYLCNNSKSFYENVAVTSLRVIRGIIFLHAANGNNKLEDQNWNNFVSSKPVQYTSAKLFRKLQLMYNSMGATVACAELVAHPNDAIRIAALRLLLVLLQDGNKIVQNTLADHLSKNRGTVFWSGLSSSIRLEIQELNAALDLKSMTEGEGEEEAGGEAEEEEEDDSKTAPVGHALEVLEVVDRMCVGGHTALQDMLCGQADNYESFDLLADIVAYAMVMHSIVKLQTDKSDMRRIIVMKQLYHTLIQMVVGPHFGNQEACLQTRVLEVTNRFLQRFHEMPLVVETSALKIEMFGFIVALMEGRARARIPRIVMNSVEWLRVMENAERTLAGLGGDAADKSQANMDSMKEEVNSICFLVRRVCAFDEKLRNGSSARLCALTPQLDCNRQARLGNLCLVHGCLENADLTSHYESYGGQIEVMWNNQPSPVFFHKFKVNQQISNTWKENVKAVIESNYDMNAAVRMRFFIGLLVEMTYDLYHQHKLARFVWFRIMLKWSGWIMNGPFYLAMLINIGVILVGVDKDWPYTDIGDSITAIYSSQGTWIAEERREWAFPALRILMVFHFLMSIVYTWCFFIQFGAPIVFRRMNAAGAISLDWLQNTKSQSGWQMSYTGAQMVPFKSIRLRYWYIFKPWTDQIWDLTTWEYQPLYVLLYPFVSLAGNWISPFFFWYHLLDIARDKIGMIIIASVTRNINRLIKTCGLALVLVYLFVILGFSYYDNKLDMCETVYMCFVSYVYLVTEGAGVATLTDFAYPSNMFNRPDVDEGVYMVYTALFGMIFVIIFGAIISGIVIDSFGGLRDEDQAIKDDLGNNCFVCGLPRFQFDEHGSGYEQHIKTEHNLWDYLLFVTYLERKDPSSLTGPEMFCKSMLVKQNKDLFPVGRAASIQADVDVAEAVSELLSKMDSTQKVISQQAAILEKHSAILDQLGPKGGSDINPK